MKNIGNVNLTFDQISSSTNLTRSGGGYIEFNFTNISGTIIKPGQSTKLTINLTIDTSKANATGIYSGWINFTSNSSAPYQNFLLTLKVNLTDLLKVQILGVDTSLGNNYVNASKDENITINLTVSYVNGTEIVSNHAWTSGDTIIFEFKDNTYFINLINPSVEISASFNIALSVPRAISLWLGTVNDFLNGCLRWIWLPF